MGHMQLSELLGQSLSEDVTVTRVVDDTRQLQEGDVFVFDKRIAPSRIEDFIQQAQQKGAAAIVSNVDQKGVFFHVFPGAILAKWARYQHARQPKCTVGVTGTNGKTSVAWFYQQIVNASGGKGSSWAASVGTLGVYQGEKKVRDTGYTSPTALVTHEILDQLAGDGVEYACLEVSSHALDLGRLDAVDFKAVALTNITQDHLDYHGTMEHYTAAKYRLFADILPDDGVAVIPAQRLEAWPLATLCKERGIRVLTVGTGNAEVVVSPVKLDANGMHVTFKYESIRRDVVLPLIGAFQAENLAVAIGLAIASGIGMEPVLAVLPNLKPVPGRMEMIEKKSDNQPTVVVDYAHTPDALEKLLECTRPLVPEGGKLWCVFGAGGDRDKTKRPLMGKVSATLSDISVVTDDNPRSEDAAQIRQEILQGSANELNIGDREAAIRHAIMEAKPNDIVVLAGKGHETGQVIGTEVHPFDDRALAHEILGKYEAK